MLLQRKQRKMGLFTMQNCCLSCSLDYVKSKLESKSRLTILELSSSQCTIYYDMLQKL